MLKIKYKPRQSFTRKDETNSQLTEIYNILTGFTLLS